MSRPLSELPSHLSAEDGKLSLIADYGNRGRSCGLYLVNRTEEDIQVSTQDGSFYAKLEVQVEDKDGTNDKTWKRAQSHWYGWCGNSYYSVELKAGSFLMNCGHVPDKAVISDASVRYRIYSDSLHHVVSNVGVGSYDPEDVLKASKDKLATAFATAEEVSSILFEETKPAGYFDSLLSKFDDDAGKRQRALGRLGKLDREDALPIIERLLASDPGAELKDILESYNRVDRELCTEFVLSELKKEKPGRILGALSSEVANDPRVVDKLLELLKNPSREKGHNRKAVQLLGSVNWCAKAATKDLIREAFSMHVQDKRYPWDTRMAMLESLESERRRSKEKGTQLFPDEKETVTQLFLEGLAKWRSKTTDPSKELDKRTAGEFLRDIHCSFASLVSLVGQGTVDQGDGVVGWVYLVVLEHELGGWHNMLSVKFTGKEPEPAVVEREDVLPLLQHLSVADKGGLQEEEPDKLFQKMRKLKSLEVSSNYKGVLRSALQHCPTLEALRILDGGISSQQAAAVVQDLKPHHKVKRVCCGCKELGRVLLPLFPNVATLSVRFVHGVDIASEIRSACPDVKHLHFNQPCGMTDADLDGLLSIPSLECFELYCLSQSTIEGVGLATANKNLKWLGLGSVLGLGVDGLKQIAQLYPSLEHFQVKGEDDWDQEAIRQLFDSNCKVELKGYGESFPREWP